MDPVCGHDVVAEGKTCLPSNTLDILYLYVSARPISHLHTTHKHKIHVGIHSELLVNVSILQWTDFNLLSEPLE